MTSSYTVTHLPCLQGEGVPGGDSLDGEGQVGGSQEEAKSPELLEEGEVSCTSDHQVLGTYNLRERNAVKDMCRLVNIISTVFPKAVNKSNKTPICRMQMQISSEEI